MRLRGRDLVLYAAYVGLLVGWHHYLSSVFTPLPSPQLQLSPQPPPQHLNHSPPPPPKVAGVNVDIDISDESSANEEKRETADQQEAEAVANAMQAMEKMAEEDVFEASSGLSRTRADQLRARARSMGYFDQREPQRSLSFNRAELGIRQPSFTATSPAARGGLVRTQSLPKGGLLSRFRGRRGSAEGIGSPQHPAPGSPGDFDALPVREIERFWRRLNEHLDPSITDDQRLRIKVALCKLAKAEEQTPTERARSVQMQWLRREMWPESYSKTEDLAFGV